MNRNEWFIVKPNSALPFWPTNQISTEKRSVILRKDKSNDISEPFWFNAKHSTSLILPSEVIFSIFIFVIINKLNQIIIGS